MKPYHEHIDNITIQILYKNEKLSSGELKKKLDDSLSKDGYNKTNPDTYWGRLKRLTTTESADNKHQQSKYAIQPVLYRHEEIKIGNLRGAKVYYSLAKPARMRCDLKLPILNNESIAEKAYRILSRSLAFENSPYRKLKDKNEYNTLLQKLGINENELQLVDGKPAEYNENLYKVTNLIHHQSGIKFNHKEYLEDSKNHGEWEYSYQLPGISINEFIANNESEISKGLAYGHIDFNEDDEVNEYFKLLEDKRLIEKVKSTYLITLNEEDRYIFVDNNNKKDTHNLQEFFRKCWLLHGSVTLYLIQKWNCIKNPADKERVWCEHLWGKKRTNQIFNSCYQTRINFLNKNNKSTIKEIKKEIQKQLISQRRVLQNQFESIQNTYSDIIDDEYSYLAKPVLNLVYPQFFR